MKPEELADGLEEVFAYDGLATDSPSAIWLADNYKALLSALRRVEKLEAALEEIEDDPGRDRRAHYRSDAGSSRRPSRTSPLQEQGK